MVDQNPENPEQQEDLSNFVPSHPGRMVTRRGLIERIIEEFQLEHGEYDSDAMKKAVDVTTRRGLVRDVAEYIFGIEAVQLDHKQKATVIARAFAEIFGYGPLEEILADESITTITFDGIDKVAVRRGPGFDLENLDPIFEDTPQLRRIVNRMLRDANADLRTNEPIIEGGFTFEGRRLSINVALPPFAPVLSADIRVHPRELPTFEQLIETGFMTESAYTLMRSIVQSRHGFIVVGDTESGKTTLLSMLLQLLPEAKHAIAIERAGELALPNDMTRLVVEWTYDDHIGKTFGEQILAGLETKRATIVLDEVRADEPKSIAPLLRDEGIPRQIWSFRGASDSNRLRASLGMLARLTDPSQSEAMVYNLAARLPFIIMVKRRKGYLQLREIAEWQFPPMATGEFTYADYVPLMEIRGDSLDQTGKRPARQLDLPETFWK